LAIWWFGDLAIYLEIELPDSPNRQLPFDAHVQLPNHQVPIGKSPIAKSINQSTNQPINQ
jgi:hypothetical protein